MKKRLKIVRFLQLLSEDFLICLGLFFIIKASFMLHEIAGYYVMGIVLCFIGYLIARRSAKGGK
ncbi:hypothetical protein [Thermoactinomyces sp. DSM 45892]|uniref:hypothetical protein n=1 Tax=Thermoactinomyces sp. DSM 45892 TaxID=1882753 RepID=UPI00089668D8|nr:hypothetical protein [Thermoactinomyces sp. DSM 45892]SDY84475.1 hypothetical protein SAMN05444416_10954 [Thermoactinomyces sp. DSM 45892]